MRLKLYRSSKVNCCGSAVLLPCEVEQVKTWWTMSSLSLFPVVAGFLSLMSVDVPSCSVLSLPPGWWCWLSHVILSYGGCFLSYDTMTAPDNDVSLWWWWYRALADGLFFSWRWPWPHTCGKSRWFFFDGDVRGRKRRTKLSSNVDANSHFCPHTSHWKHSMKWDTLN